MAPRQSWYLIEIASNSSASENLCATLFTIAQHTRPSSIDVQSRLQEYWRFQARLSFFKWLWLAATANKFATLSARVPQRHMLRVLHVVNVKAFSASSPRLLILQLPESFFRSPLGSAWEWCIAMRWIQHWVVPSVREISNEHAQNRSRSDIVDIVSIVFQARDRDERSADQRC